VIDTAWKKGGKDTAFLLDVADCQGETTNHLLLTYTKRHFYLSSAVIVKNDPKKSALVAFMVLRLLNWMHRAGDASAPAAGSPFYMGKDCAGMNVFACAGHEQTSCNQKFPRHFF
jgi:hypothetical protein